MRSRLSLQQRGKVWFQSRVKTTTIECQRFIRALLPLKMQHFANLSAWQSLTNRNLLTVI